MDISNTTLNCILQMQKEGLRKLGFTESEFLHAMNVVPAQVGAKIDSIDMEAYGELPFGKMESFWQKPPENMVPLTRLDVPYWRTILDDMGRPLLEASDALDYPRPKLPLFAVSFSNQLNAEIHKNLDNDETVIFMHLQLLVAALLLGKSIGLAFPIIVHSLGPPMEYQVDSTGWRERLQDNPEAYDRFRDLIQAHSYYGTATSAEQYHLHPNQMGIVFRLINAIESFVIGHEYAHALEGHLDDGNYFKCLDGNDDVPEINLSWEQEYEADWTAARLIDQSQQDAHHVGYDSFLVGARILFGFMDIFEQVRDIFDESTDPSSSSHPPAMQRWERLVEHVDDERNNIEDLDIKMGHAVQVGTVLDELWSKTKPIIEHDRQQGARLHPIWVS